MLFFKWMNIILTNNNIQCILHSIIYGHCELWVHDMWLSIKYAVVDCPLYYYFIWYYGNNCHTSFWSCFQSKGHLKVVFNTDNMTHLFCLYLLAAEEMGSCGMWFLLHSAFSGFPAPPTPVLGSVWGFGLK